MPRSRNHARADLRSGSGALDHAAASSIAAKVRSGMQSVSGEHMLRLTRQHHMRREIHEATADWYVRGVPAGLDLCGSPAGAGRCGCEDVPIMWPPRTLTVYFPTTVTEL